MAKKNFSDLKQNGKLPDPKTVDRNSIIEELWEDYLDSTSNSLPQLESSALKLEKGEEPDENAANIKRILHSLKGESGMVGLQDVHDLCHEVESALEKLEDNLKKADMVLKAKDWMQIAIDVTTNKGEVAEAEKPRQKDALVVEEKNAVKKFRKALIVDDAVVCRKRIRMLLKNYFKCFFATNGQEAVDLYKKSLDANEPYDLVTLDINMPELDGHSTLTAIREYEGTKNIDGLDGVKIIMTTSQDKSEHVFKAFRQGCEAYVVKSNMGDKLLSEVAKLGLLKVSDYMDAEKTISLKKQLPVFDAAKVFADTHKTSIPVVNDDMTVAGLICESDILEYLTANKEVKATVADFMTDKVTCFDQNASLIEVCKEFTKNLEKRRFPIVSDGKLVGIISRKDVISYIVRLREEADSKS